MNRAALKQRVDEIGARLRDTNIAIEATRILGGKGWPSTIGRLHLRADDLTRELNTAIFHLNNTFKRGPSKDEPGQEFVFSV